MPAPTKSKRPGVALAKTQSKKKSLTRRTEQVNCSPPGRERVTVKTSSSPEAAGRYDVGESKKT
jgi:hypothetical protein